MFLFLEAIKVKGVSPLGFAELMMLCVSFFEVKGDCAASYAG